VKRTGLRPSASESAATAVHTVPRTGQRFCSSGTEGLTTGNKVEGTKEVYFQEGILSLGVATKENRLTLIVETPRCR
jgi:hypothetical protein